MELGTSILDVLKSLEVALPLILSAVILITEVLKKVFKFDNPLVSQITSWVLSIACAEIFVATGQLDFGLGWINYILGAVCGVICGLISNGIVDIKWIDDLLQILMKLIGLKK